MSSKSHYFFIPELIDMIFEYIQEPQTDRLTLLVNYYFRESFIYRNKHELIFYKVKNDVNSISNRIESFLGSKKLVKKGNTLFLTKKHISFANINSKNVVNFFISKGANELNWGMYYAALGGHLNLVQFFISKGANDWKWGMKYAAEGGHFDLVQLFISKGADNWDLVMYMAAESGHLDIVKFFISKGADDWNGGMYYAEQGGHKNLVEFFNNKLKKKINKIKYIITNVL